MAGAKEKNAKDGSGILSRIKTAHSSYMQKARSIQKRQRELLKRVLKKRDERKAAEILTDIEGR